jgi:apolipoprotein N-acyltransferase
VGALIVAKERGITFGWLTRWVPNNPVVLLVSGVLLGLAHPPFHLLLPSFLALVPFVVWLESLPPGPEGRREARRGGFFLGLVYYTLVFYWLLIALIFYTALAILAFLAPVLILCTFLAWMAGAIHSVRERVGWPVWAAVPVFWTANEWLRGHLGDVAFPWMQLGDTLTGFPWLIGAADVVGSRGMSFWLALVNGLIAVCWMAYRARRRDRAAASLTRPAVTLVLVLAVPTAYSLARWWTLEMRPVARVGVVQPNVPEDIKLQPTLAIDSAQRATATLAGAWDGGAADLDLVILPESALPAYIDPIETRGWPGRPDLEAWVAALAVGVEAPVLYGALGGVDHPDGRWDYFNSAFLVSETGERKGRYDKRFLVPVVERVPFLNPRWFGGLSYLGGFGVGEWGRSYEVPVESAGAGETAAFGVMICYESIFSPLARHYRAAGADFLVNITNDAWFGREAWWSRSSALWQHPAHLVMRAIETRVGIARSANTGVSELVDPLGRVTHATPLFEPAAFTGQVMTTDSRTVYVRFGDVVGWGSVLLAIAGLAQAILRGRMISRRTG